MALLQSFFDKRPISWPDPTNGSCRINTQTTPKSTKEHKAFFVFFCGDIQFKSSRFGRSLAKKQQKQNQYAACDTRRNHPNTQPIGYFFGIGVGG